VLILRGMLGLARLGSQAGFCSLFSLSFSSRHPTRRHEQGYCLTIKPGWLNATAERRRKDPSFQEGGSLLLCAILPFSLSLRAMVLRCSTK